MDQHQTLLYGHVADAEGVPCPKKLMIYMFTCSTKTSTYNNTMSRVGHLKSSKLLVVSFLLVAMPVLLVSFLLLVVRASSY